MPRLAHGGSDQRRKRINGLADEPTGPSARSSLDGQNASQKTANLWVVRHLQETKEDGIGSGNFSIGR
jgi:hypothetical protein